MEIKQEISKNHINQRKKSQEIKNIFELNEN